MAILYADRSDRRKSPGVPGVAGDFIRRSHARYRRLNSPVFAKCVHSRDFLRSPLRIANEVNQSGGRFYHMNFQNGGHERGHFISFHFIFGNEIEVPNHRDRRKRIAQCARINRWRNSLAIFAGDQIRCDWRIKSRVSCVADFKIIRHVNI